ncbi:MAG: hypothetical protein HY324_00455 [Chlamydiia bacterium]|nr:hypothetical protein [Chlamydiia bacterium]
MKFLLIYLTFFSLQATPIPIFHPPDEWEAALPKNHSPFLQIAFLGKGSTELRPSVNLSIEDIDTTEKEYLKAVKSIHRKEPDTTWRDLGKFSTHAGIARLTEITKKVPVGELKMLQLILIKDHKAYILTGAASKADFMKEHSRLLQTFRSFSLPEDLLAPLSSDSRARFEDFFSHLAEEIKNGYSDQMQAQDVQMFQKVVAENSSTMGKYWELLMLKEGLAKISQKE